MKKLLIANRGEIACRIMRTARRDGHRDGRGLFRCRRRKALHVREATRAVHIAPLARQPESYLDGDEDHRGGASRSGADAIHPGYGFLSENADFAQAVRNAGLIFVGPPEAASIRVMGAEGRGQGRG
jgi:3-methylcrotonyl-CoA carboxylase alpha subunit